MIQLKLQQLQCKEKYLEWLTYICSVNCEIALKYNAFVSMYMNLINLYKHLHKHFTMLTFYKSRKKIYIDIPLKVSLNGVSQCAD